MTSDSVGSQWLRPVSSVYTLPANLPQLPPLWDSANVAANLEQALEPALKRRKVENQRAASSGGSQSDFAQPWPTLAPDKSSHGRSDHAFRQTRECKTNPALRHNDPRTIRHGPPLFPQRRDQSTSQCNTRNISSAVVKRTVALGQVETKPFVLEPPPSAPRFRHGEGPADFYPWTGNHFEDVLNESTTKNGLYDKPQATQNESATARPAIWSSLKHKSGLQILSSLLVSVFDQREAHGTVTANCTFKPPPRVTLTDTKREAWLRDLANPDIPLRRLSRTIPHGIRGKVLLDHCLAKVIPTARAVWLAKCVGANEIRAFKRKGAGGAFAVGGEMKWIKDWTANVEQFIEFIVSDCGTASWRTRVDYGLRLTSHLASEHLLDQGHYFNWIISSLQNSDLEILPIWILIVQLHVQDLFQQRQYGTRLVQVLLDQLHLTTNPTNEGVYDKILHQVSQLLELTVLSAPTCFLMPRVWDRHEPLLRRSLNDRTKSVYNSLDCLSARNKQLQSQDSQRPSISKQSVIRLLDTAFEDFDIAQLAKECLFLMPSTDSLISTCLQWGASVYRTGDAMVYLTVRLLRRFWNGKSGLDASVMKFVATSADCEGLSKPRLYRILAELFRSKHLVVGKYLQWLMARGSTNRISAPEQHGPCDARLLLEMPTDGLPSHVSNLRSILLSKLGASVEDERKAIRSLQSSIADRIPDIFPRPGTGLGLEVHVYDPTRLSTSIKSTVAQWIRQTIASRLIHKKSQGHERDDATPERLLPPLIALDQFKAVRSILEDLEDFAILADVLRITAESEDVSVLTHVCETVTTHLSTFAAIGALQDLFLTLLRRSEAVRKSTPTHQILIESLIELGKRTPKRAKECRHLRAQIQRYRQSVTAMVACSPISDHMTEALQPAESTYLDDIDQVLANSTSMDKRNLTQLFESIIRRFELAWLDAKQSDVVVPELLSRLRPFDPKVFDGLLGSWTRGLLQSPTHYNIPVLLSSFIFSECLTLDKVLGIGRDVLHDVAVADHHLMMAMDLLQLLAVSKQKSFISTASKGYRLRLQQADILRYSPTLVIPFLLPTVEAYASPQQQLRDRARSLILDHGVQTLVKTLTVHDPKALQNIGFSAGAVALLDKLIFPYGQRYMQTQEDGDLLQRLMMQVNHCSLPLCQFRLKTLLTHGTASPEIDALPLINILRSGFESSSSVLWPELISGLPPSLCEFIRQTLERDILSKTPCRLATWESDDNKSVIDRMLSIIEAIGVGSPSQIDFPLISQIGDKFAHLLPSQRLATNQPRTSPRRESDGAPPILQNAVADLDVLLRLLIVHQPTIQHLQFPQPMLISLLLSLSLLLVHPYLPATQNSTINDILLVLSDSLSEESRNRCIRSLREQRVYDPRLHFILGYSEISDAEWLQVVTHSTTSPDVKSAGVAAPTPITKITHPYPLRRWEIMMDSTPLVGANDTSLSLTLFETRKSVL